MYNFSLFKLYTTLHEIQSNLRDLNDGIVSNGEIDNELALMINIDNARELLNDLEQSLLKQPGS
ncbi:MAG: hypothetical protein AABY07_01340 [Nanoarchaeota archaeon]